MEFRVARLPEHNHLLEQVQTISALIRQRHPELATALVARWSGSRHEFGNV